MNSLLTPPLRRRKLGGLTRWLLLAFVAKGLLSSALILWALYSAAGA
ncbi:MAG TPA: hypothetical protein VGM74_08235 [Burkholderiaceae bacterium]|jgi:ABC-type cobalamin transport system permease subunit